MDKTHEKQAFIVVLLTTCY